MSKSSRMLFGYGNDLLFFDFIKNLLFNTIDYCFGAFNKFIFIQTSIVRNNIMRNILSIRRQSVKYNHTEIPYTHARRFVYNILLQNNSF